MQYKRFRRGTHRCAPPSETIAKISQYIDAFGITRVANITGLDNIGLPVVMVVRPNSRSLAVFQGKGNSLLDAKVSGLMEAIETYHAERFFVPGFLLSYEEISAKFNTVDITKVSRSKKGTFSSQSKIFWIQAQDILNQREAWVPHALIHTDYTAPFSAGHENFITDTNGLASGNTQTEAEIHALCEVIERDALALWETNSIEEKNNLRIDPATIDDIHLKNLLEKVDNAGASIGLWDITSDIGIPVYICKIIPSDFTPQLGIRPAYGSGCHLDKNIALSRAITEAAQSRLTFISGTRDDQPPSLYKKYLSEEVLNKWRAEIANECSLDYRACATYQNDSLEEDHNQILENLKRVGIKQAIVVNLSREDFNIPVVKVIIPGLESITKPHERLFGSRLQKKLGIPQ